MHLLFYHNRARPRIAGLPIKATSPRREHYAQLPPQERKTEKITIKLKMDLDLHSG
jgi:hypothetical protein